MATITSVNVGRPRTVEWLGRSVTSAIWKDPVEGPVRLAGVNLAGDDQADRRVHGGPDKAVYAYGAEDYEWWAGLGLGLGPFVPGTFGENLTTSGIDLRACRIGDRWRVGSAELEVAQPREPCFKLGMRMGDADFPGRFTAARRPGAYLRIVEPGVVEAGDRIDVDPTSDPATAIGELVGEEIAVATFEAIVADRRVPAGWRRTAERALARADDTSF